MRLSIILIFVISVIVPAGCKSKISIANEKKYFVFDSLEIFPGDPAVIRGTIKNRDFYKDIKEVNLSFSNFSGYENRTKTLISENGTFEFLVYPVIAREISLKPVADVVIIHPGDTMEISCDFQYISHPMFTGDAARLNNNINRFIYGYYLRQYSNGRRIPDPAAYLDYCNNYRKNALEKLELYKKEYTTEDEFNKWSGTMIDADYYSALLRYMMRKRLTSVNRIDPPDGYYDFIKSIPEIFDNTIIISGYYRLIESYYNNYLGPLIIEKYKDEGSQDDKLVSRFIEDITTSTDNELFNEFIAGGFFNMLLRNHKTEMFEKVRKYIPEKIREPFLLKDLSERYKHAREFSAKSDSLRQIVMKAKIVKI